MTWLIENWVVVVSGLAVMAVAGGAAWKFFKLPSVEQIKKVKEWLLWACVEAEKELGGGTGKIKLRQVYDLFVQRFPSIAMMVSFDTFALWVDSALEEMRKMLGENKAVRQMVGGVGILGED